MQTLGCIGCGCMGSALMLGFAGKLDKNRWNLCAFNRTAEKTAPLAEKGIAILASASEVAAKSDILILAVKPHQLPELLRNIQTYIKQDAIVVSIAAGYSLEKMRLLLGTQFRLARCMPTLTAMVGHGVFALCPDPVNMTDAARKSLVELFSTLGICVEIEEKMFTEFSAFIGAGPAYIFAMLRGLEQAGLTVGFPLAQAAAMLTELAAGCAELARTQNKSFMRLRDEVCSPGGLSIAGVNVLDRAGLAGLVVEAVRAAADRGREMES